MNASSILLEGTRRVSQGRMVRLNLAQVKNYSLFPGQVCVCVCVRVCVYLCICMQVCVCVYTFIYVCVGGCECTCTYI